MSSFLRWSQGLLLILLGGFMLTLVTTGNAWQFLNPKFQWLTGSTGAGLMLCGAFLPLSPFCRPRPGTVLALAAFLLVAGLAGQNLTSPGGPAGFASPAPAAPPEPSRLSENGQEYIKINTAELYLLGEAEPPSMGSRYAVQGMALRAGELDVRGELALVRLSIVCCLADALAVGLRVTGVVAGDVPAGAWVRICGRLAPADPASPNPTLTLPGVVTTMLSERITLAAEAVEVIEPPQVPYMFEFHDREPYAY
jgi:hypothetical protein